MISIFNGFFKALSQLIAVLTIFFFSFSFPVKASDQNNNTSDPTSDDVFYGKYLTQILDFAVANTVSTIIHETGHYYIDVFDIPTFGQDEDIADSFMTYYLIHTPNQYSSYEAYEQGSYYDHEYLKGEVNNYFFKILLDRDSSYSFDPHSNDQKRFYNILCSMKDGNPKVFNDFFTTRDINYDLSYDCVEGVYDNITNSWEAYLGDMWIGGGAETIGSIILHFEEGQIMENGEKDIYPGILEARIDGIDLFNDFDLQLPKDLNIYFNYCDGSINAYYYPGFYEIEYCYELFKDYVSTAVDLFTLKEAL